MTKRVVITDHEHSAVEAEEAATHAHGAEFIVTQTTDEDQVAEITQGADVVVVNYARMTERVLHGLATGATVVRYGVGFDVVDVAAASRAGVQVCNIPDYGADTVADHAVTLALSVLRRVPVYDRGVRGFDAGWMLAREAGPIPAVGDITCGLVGTGTIGQLVAARLQAFGAEVIAYDPYADAGRLAERGIELVGLNALLERAGVISLHAPLTEQTHHLLDAAALAKTQPGVVIVNTARGALLDTEAAAQLCIDGHIGGLGLDVFESEPLELEHPVRQAPNTVLTPHAAFYSTRALRNMQTFAADEISRALAGKAPRSPVN